MNSPLDEACAILDEFEKEIAQTQAIWKQLEEDNPHFEEVSSSSWSRKHYRLWLHGATKVLECNELEKWLYDSPSVTATANSSAQRIHVDWRDWLETAGIPK